MVITFPPCCTHEQDDCLAFNDRCKQQIDEALDIADTLLTRMHDDGIAHIVFMGPFYVLDLNEVRRPLGRSVD